MLELLFLLTFKKKYFGKDLRLELKNVCVFVHHKAFTQNMFYIKKAKHLGGIHLIWHNYSNLKLCCALYIKKCKWESLHLKG